MKKAWCIAAILGLTLVAMAQEPARPERGRGRGRGADEPGGPGGGMRLMAQRLAEELALTPEQRQQFDALVTRFEAERPAPEQRQQMRELARQYREARDAGDDAKAQELREQMRAQGAGRFSAAREFYTEVEKILTPEQAQKMQAFRDRFQRGEGPPGEPGAGRGRDEARGLLRRLPEELQLTEEQRAQFDEILQAQREKARPQMQEWRQQRQQLEEELAAARSAGDEARVAELEDQLASARPRPDMEGILSQIEPILTDEQKARLTQLRQEMPGPGGGVGDVRAVLRAARRLDLRPEQRDQLTTIQREAQDAERNGSNDAAARAARAEAVRAQIVAVLDAEQAAEFERLLSSSGSGRGAGPAAGAERRPRGNGDGGPGAGRPGGAGGGGGVQRRLRDGQGNGGSPPAGDRGAGNGAR